MDRDQFVEPAKMGEISMIDILANTRVLTRWDDMKAGKDVEMERVSDDFEESEDEVRKDADQEVRSEDP